MKLLKIVSLSMLFPFSTPAHTEPQQPAAEVTQMIRATVTILRSTSIKGRRRSLLSMPAVGWIHRIGTLWYPSWRSERDARSLLTIAPVLAAAMKCRGRGVC